MSATRDEPFVGANRVAPLPPLVSSSATIGGRAAHGLVDAEGSSVSRALFCDESLYRLELERIFARCWLYLAHETQLTAPGAFVVTTMGEDPVIVARGGDGKLRAFLNSCTHRGAKVCRHDQGVAKTFRCSYHAWSFNTEGELIGVPRQEAVYGPHFDRSRYGLREVAQLDTIGGMIFATWDPFAPPLREYLGDMTFYLDLVLNRMEGGVEVIGGVHKWTVPCNWKIPAENAAGDHYHVPSAHAAGIEMGYRSQLTNNGYCIQTGNGHSIGSEQGGGPIQGKTLQTEYAAFLAEMRGQAVAKFGASGGDFVPVGIGTLFPNFTFMDTARFRTFRIWQPRGVDTIDIYSWCLVDRAMPEDLKVKVRRQYTLTFGPAGLFEQDDGDVWTSIQETMRGHIGRQGRFNFEMGLGREGTAAARYGEAFPGASSDLLMTEANQRAYYRHWARVMADPV